MPGPLETKETWVDCCSSKGPMVQQTETETAQGPLSAVERGKNRVEDDSNILASHRVPEGLVSVSS